MHDDRRRETRLLCAELVEVIWKDNVGMQRRRIANLEDISLSGACLQVESAILRGTHVSMRYGGAELTGTICYCLYRDMGYFLGVEFDAGVKWSTKHFRPKHLLDPRRLVNQTVRRLELAHGPTASQAEASRHELN